MPAKGFLFSKLSLQGGIEHCHYIYPDKYQEMYCDQAS